MAELVFGRGSEQFCMALAQNGTCHLQFFDSVSWCASPSFEGLAGVLASVEKLSVTATHMGHLSELGLKDVSQDLTGMAFGVLTKTSRIAQHLCWSNSFCTVPGLNGSWPLPGCMLNSDCRKPTSSAINAHTLRTPGVMS